MQRIKFTLLTVLAFCLMTMPACKTPEQTAYRSLGTTAVLVDGAMNGWGDYVRKGLATPEDQIRVRYVYERYQGAMKVASSVTLAMKETQTKNDPLWLQVVSAVTASANDVINLVAQFVPSIKPITKTP